MSPRQYFDAALGRWLTKLEKVGKKTVFTFEGNGVLEFKTSPGRTESLVVTGAVLEVCAGKTKSKPYLSIDVLQGRAAILDLLLLENKGPHDLKLTLTKRGKAVVLSLEQCVVKNWLVPSGQSTQRTAVLLRIKRVLL